ncbi:MAG TPA: formyl transferase, partial [Porticoccaceae bacterium]|nr:formyl transferase [Porticoccaceae bacterium]
LKSPEALSRVAATEPDLILSIRFGLILPQTIIDLPKYGVINLHSGLLPVYRGV